MRREEVPLRLDEGLRAQREKSREAAAARRVAETEAAVNEGVELMPGTASKTACESTSESKRF